jgi:quinol monooxygenase YgiN
MLRKDIDMFGTIARLSLKPGVEGELSEMMKEYDQITIPGHVTTHVYRMDSNPNECYLATVFESRDSYFANANSPEQDARFRRMMDMLTSEPEWHDGEIVYSEVSARTSTH